MAVYLGRERVEHSGGRMPAELPAAPLEAVADGLYRFDTGYIRPRHTACFVVVDGDRAAIEELGVLRAGIETALGELGYPERGAG